MREQRLINFIKQYWKLLLLLAYAIAVPLYFHQSTKGIQQAFDSSRESSQKQISILEGALEDQRLYYDQLFQEYQDRMDAEELRYEEELTKIKETQASQQKQLAKRFKENPSAISDELSKRYGLNAQ